MGKYQTQAEMLSTELTKIINNLTSNEFNDMFIQIKNKLDEIDDKDVLKDNVLKESREISNKFETFKSTISKYNGQILWKASRFDEEEYLLAQNNSSTDEELL